MIFTKEEKLENPKKNSRDKGENNTPNELNSAAPKTYNVDSYLNSTTTKRQKQTNGP